MSNDYHLDAGARGRERRAAAQPRDPELLDEPRLHDHHLAVGQRERHPQLPERQQLPQHSTSTTTTSTFSASPASPSDTYPGLPCIGGTRMAAGGLPDLGAALPHTRRRGAGRLVTTDVADLAWPPRLASGTELLGEIKDSGVTEPPSLVRRADGQVIQLSRLLYLVASLLDGSRGPDVIAAKATAELGRTLSAEQVGYLITAKLAPLGIVATATAPAALPTARPLLALRARATLLPAGRGRRGRVPAAVVQLAGDRGRYRRRRRPRLLDYLRARTGRRAAAAP